MKLIRLQKIKKQLFLWSVVHIKQNKTRKKTKEYTFFSLFLKHEKLKSDELKHSQLLNLHINITELLLRSIQKCQLHP